MELLKPTLFMFASTTTKQSKTELCAWFVRNIASSCFVAEFVEILRVIQMVSCEGGNWQIQSFEIQLLDRAHPVVALQYFMHVLNLESLEIPGAVFTNVV